MDIERELPVIQAPPSLRKALEVVEVTFKGNRRDYFTTTDEGIKPGIHVVVEVDRGQDLGKVKTIGGVAAKKCAGCNTEKGGAKNGSASATPSARVLRRAEADEIDRLVILRSDEERVRRTAREMVLKQGLKMKISEVEWQWDKNKLTLYFTAERRVDFRQLVRDLARTFRTRIELKQIGVRDEAALLGGVGRCGRELCCSTWLREIKPISLQLAKDQNLSLNPAQISGTCGRLMCCLTYEHDAYLQARKRFPREGRIIQTAEGQEKVIGIDIWREQVTLLDDSRQRRVVALGDLKAETTATIREKAETADDSSSADAPATGRRTRPPRRNR